LFWKVGKYVFEKHQTVENIICKVSDFYSYKYGLNYTFSIYNINMMKCFYLYFPVYSKKLENLSWNHYLELIKICDNNKRNFYFMVSMFCDFSVEEMLFCLNNFCYERI